MGKVITGFTMSLDGFNAGPNNNVGPLFKWFASGDTPFPLPGTDLVFQMSRASAEHIEELWGSIGAMVTGRHDFDVSHAWGDKPPYGWPSFIVTHTPPQDWDKPGASFAFVSDGVASAINQAKRAAGDKHVVVGGIIVVAQCSKRACWTRSILIDLAPMLLGAGKRLFEQLDAQPNELERLQVVEGQDVMHIGFRVVK